MRQATSLLLAACWFVEVSAQPSSDPDEFWQRLREIEEGGPFSGRDWCGDASSLVPLVKPVFGRKGDHWPNDVEIIGRVTGLLPGYCGIACNAATLRVEVTESNKPLPSPELHLFTWCVYEADAERYCGETVRFTATKLRKIGKHCGIRTTFDSRGAPFYVVADADRDIQLLKASPQSESGDQAPNRPISPPHSAVMARAHCGTRLARGRAGYRYR